MKFHWSRPLAIAVTMTTAAQAAGNAEHGQELWESRCTGCHSLDTNRVGPKHRGVYGRKAGSIADFAYSPGVKNSPVVWDEKTLDRWLTSPQDFIPGARMGFRVGTAEDRGDIIAYLKKESGK